MYIPCPSPDAIAGFMDGALPGAAAREIETHIDACDFCRRHISAIARGAMTETFTSPDETEPDRSRDEEGPLGPGARVGRYLVIRVIACGGMGRVVLAHDPELRRQVALKVLRPALWRRVGPGARERLLGEAIAMAKIVHPNIVTVFDVGTWGDEAFVAMEFVDGSTLRDWLRAGPRPWRQVLAVCVGAGRGLAAAHQGGVVHRDCKPGNILVAAGGRVLVSDFGLALVEEAGAGAGQMAGTLGYMSPEQMDRRPVDEASDQFSFAATTWEALFGTRPFPGERMAAVRAAIGHGPVAPALARVPRAVRRALERGLAGSSGARFPSMTALVDELERAARPRTPRLIAIVAAALALASAFIAVARPGGEPERVACSGKPERLAGVWDAERRVQVAAAFRATGAADGDLARLTAALDQRARSWDAAHREACRATDELGEQSSALLDARLACLGGQRAQMASLVDGVAGGTSPGVTHHAIAAALALPPSERCSGEELSARGAPARFARDPVAAARAARLDELLGRAAALHGLGRLPEERAVLAAAAVEAASVGDPVRHGRTLLQLGVNQRKAFEQPAAEQTLEQAARIAAGAGDDRTAATAVLEHLALVGLDQQRKQEASLLERAAERELARARAPELDARLAFHRGLIALTDNDPAAAAEHGARARSLLEAVYGPDDWHLAAAHRLAGTAAAELGRNDQAMAAFRLSLELIERGHGPDAPDVASVLNLISGLARKRGDLPAARRDAERALAIRQRLFGPEHPSVTHTLTGLASIAADAGDLEGARRMFERVVAGEERALGPAHWQRTVAMTRLAGVLRRLGERGRARRVLGEAVAILEKALGPDEPKLRLPLLELALVSKAEGRCAEAARLLARAGGLEQPASPDEQALAVDASSAGCAGRGTRTAQGSSPAARRR